jgi:type I restriction enzyme, S subunit
VVEKFPFKIPDDWEIKRLHEIANVTGGKRLPKGKSLVETNTGHPYIRVSDMDEKGISLQNIMYVPIDIVDSIKRYTVKSGDLYISVAGTLGLIGEIPDELDGANLTENADRISNIRCNRTFLKYVLKSEIVQNVIDREKTLNAQPKLALTRIKNFLIPLPPPVEQNRIAAILSSVDEAIEKTEAIIEQTEKVKKGLMQQLLTKGIGHTKFKKTAIGEIPEDWVLKRIGDLVKFEGGSQPPRSTFIFEPKEGYIRLLQIRDYKTDKYATYIPIELAKKFCNEDDVMIGRYGPPIFQILRGLKGAYNVALIKAIPDENFVTKDYLYYFLKQEPLFKLIDSLSQRTSGQTGIDMDALKNYGFPLPPITEQKKITAILDKVQAKLDKENDYLQQLQYIKKGLMQVLLTGKVRVKVEDEVMSQ